MVKAELRKTILNGTMEVFNQKGLKFTMDDIAKQLGISKKTIYKVFNDKEEMFLEYSELLNSFDSGATTKITINNRRLNRLDFEKSILIPLS